MNVTRRSVLKTGIGAATASAFAGCLGNDIEADGYAAFFPLWDWAQQVSGDQLEFANPVSTGRMGHGWSPDGNLATDVASTEVFLYLDTPEFAWAQDIAATLERDYDDVAVVDLLAGVDLPEVDGGHDGDGESGEDGSDEGGQHDERHDPHAWVDPVLAQEMVGNTADALVDLDPDNGDTYETNADEYADRLGAVDSQFADLIGSATREVAVFAGHNSFQYLEHRYGFELVTPVGVTPDAAESIDDVAGLIETIEEHDIETVLYDPFEAPDPGNSLPQAVELLFENTQADQAEPLTPVSGTTEQWADNGWGWAQQMEEINLASLETALNPS